MPAAQGDWLSIAASVTEAMHVVVLSLNTGKRRDLAGLGRMVRENRPDLLFLQEVNLQEQELQQVARSLGYKAVSSQANKPKRTIAVLSRMPVEVEELEPGYLQLVRG